VLKTDTEVKAACPGNVCLTRDGYEMAQTGKTLLTLNAVAFGVGIAGVGVGAALFVFGGRGAKAKQETSFVVGPQGISVRGSF
jgi:TctA family transporter